MYSVATSYDAVGLVYNVLNDELFGNVLAPINVKMVTGSNRRRFKYIKYNIIAVADWWMDGECGRVVQELLHEMVHMYCSFVVKQKSDSNRGYYHNLTFSRYANRFGLSTVSERNPESGYIDISLNKDGVAVINRHPEIQQIISSGISNSEDAVGYRYICPKCGRAVSTDATIKVFCVDCDEQMLLPCEIAENKEKEKPAMCVDIDELPDEMSLGDVMSLFESGSSL